MLSTTLRHPNGCPLTVGHPLSLGISGSLTRSSSEKGRFDRYFWTPPALISSQNSRRCNCRLLATAHSPRTTTTEHEDFSHLRLLLQARQSSQQRQHLAKLVELRKLEYGFS